MRASRLTLAAAAVLLAPLAPLAPAATLAAQGIEIDDFQDGVRSHSLGTTPPLRRGVTSSVRVVKDLIDLVPFNMVSISGGGTIGSISNGRTSAGRGYIQMNVTLPAGQALGSTVTIKVGLTDQFPFTVVRTGQVTAITRAPDPSTLQPGAPWVATVQGVDLGAPTVRATCHSATVGAASNTSIPVTLTRTSTCGGATQYALTITPAGANAPPSYAMTNGGPAGTAFSYAPAPPSGTVCASNANVGAPIIRTPTPNQLIVLGAGTPSPTNVTVRWDSLTSNNVPAPNNEWLVARTGNLKTSTQVVSISPALTLSSPVTVTGTSRALSFAIPGTYTVQVTAKNCGQTAPSSRVTFTLQYQ